MAKYVPTVDGFNWNGKVYNTDDLVELTEAEAAGQPVVLYEGGVLDSSKGFKDAATDGAAPGTSSE